MIGCRCVVVCWNLLWHVLTFGFPPLFHDICDSIIIHSDQTNYNKLFCGHADDSTGASATQAEKEEVDARSIYVGNVSFLALN